MKIKTCFSQKQLGHFRICFPMKDRDFSVKQKVVFSLFQTVKLRLSIFTVCKFALPPIEYHLSSFYSMSISYK